MTPHEHAADRLARELGPGGAVIAEPPPMASSARDWKHGAYRLRPATAAELRTRREGAT
jgi:hypothetical protein